MPLAVCVLASLFVAVWYMFGRDDPRDKTVGLVGLIASSLALFFLAWAARERWIGRGSKARLPVPLITQPQRETAAADVQLASQELRPIEGDVAYEFARTLSADDPERFRFSVPLDHERHECLWYLNDELVSRAVEAFTRGETDPNAEPEAQRMQGILAEQLTGVEMAVLKSDHRILLEPDSTDLRENIGFSERLLQRVADSTGRTGLRVVLASAPYTLRRLRWVAEATWHAPLVSEVLVAHGRNDFERAVVRRLAEGAAQIRYQANAPEGRHVFGTAIKRYVNENFKLLGGRAAGEF